MRPAPHYSTELGEDLRGNRTSHESVGELEFWMAISETFDGQNRIDSIERHALRF